MFTFIEWILAFLLIGASLGVILARKPVYASLFFLVTLLVLASVYLLLSAEFVAVMQVLVYAGAILVLFMFVIILFQDAHQQIGKHPGKSAPLLIAVATGCILLTFILLGKTLLDLPSIAPELPDAFGSVRTLGKTLYVDFFFPFEALILLFLVAMVGALYVGKKVK